MKSLTAGEISNAVNGKIIRGNPRLLINRISTDSREVTPGDLFIPLKGENHDAHKFIPGAVEKGAAGIIVDREIDTDSGPVIIKTEDTNRALQDLAHYYRLSLSGLEVIGITGSSGKTTTKDIIAGILKEEYTVLKTEGNLNNYFGLPLTLLSLNGDEEVAVLEMGMSEPGEINLLTEIAEPRIGVITNVGPTHLEFLETVENVAREKSKLITGLPGDGIAVLNYDDQLVRKMGEDFTGHKIIYYGLDAECDIFADNIERQPGEFASRFQVHVSGEGEEIFLNTPGIHNIYNALAAIAVARELNVSWASIKKGLKNLELTELRQDIIELEDLTIINDTYNANPMSVRAALQVLNDTAVNRRIAVLGAMLELGNREEKAHLEVGEYTAKLGIDILITVGKTAALIGKGAGNTDCNSLQIMHVENNQQASQLLNRILQSGDTVLVKGSRANKMEEIVVGICEQGG